MCPGVDSASKYEYQDTPGSKAGRCVRLTTYHFLVPDVKKIRGPTYRIPMGLFRPVAGQFFFSFFIGHLLGDG
jgi:hypothetical protein